jgi:ankyrin repeat protein
MQRPVVRGVVATAFLGLCASPELWWEKEARWLIEERGAAIDDAWTHCGMNPLHVASLVGLEESVVWLLSRGARVDRRILHSGAHGATAQETALHVAARSGHASIAQILLSAGADASLWDDRKRTPFAAALAAGHSAMGPLLQKQISRPGAVRAANSAGIAAAAALPH